MWVIVTGMWIAITGMIIVRGSNAFQSAIADLGTEILDFGFTEDTVKMPLEVVGWIEWQRRIHTSKCCLKGIYRRLVGWWRKESALQRVSFHFPYGYAQRRMSLSFSWVVGRPRLVTTHVLRSPQSDSCNARDMFQAQFGNRLPGLLLIARVYLD